MTRLGICGLAVLAMLAGCGAPEPKTERANNITFEDSNVFVPKAELDTNLANVATPARPAVTLSPEGLGIVSAGGATRQIAFGAARASAIEALSAALGAPIEQGDNQECGAGALSFANFGGGLGLYFQDGQFAGWDVDGSEAGRFATGNGIAIGTTRKQLEAAGETSVEDSSIGIEFASGGLSGLLDARSPEGKVTNLWAGMTCIAR